jgi:hypothetical protein
VALEKPKKKKYTAPKLKSEKVFVCAFGFTEDAALPPKEPGQELH